jgi:serine/threonine-protein kinase PRP4
MLALWHLVVALRESFLWKPQVPEAEAKEVMKLRDMLDRIFTLDPAKRLTVQQALQHPFLTSSRAND